jgi:aryl-alcohol dehydrogenase-like predicted oxidoreductase
MNAYCNFAGIGIIPYGPLSDGHLARPIGSPLTQRQSVRKGTALERHLTETDKEIINRVESLAAKKNVKMAQIALAWIQTKCTSPIVGINKVSRSEKSEMWFRMGSEVQLSRLSVFRSQLLVPISSHLRISSFWKNREPVLETVFII